MICVEQCSGLSIRLWFFVLFRRLISVLPQNEVCETLTCSVSPVTEIYLLQSCCKKKIGGLFA